MTDKHGEFTRVILQQAPFHRPLVAFERRHFDLSEQKSEKPARMQWTGRNDRKLKQPIIQGRVCIVSNSSLCFETTRNIKFGCNIDQLRCKNVIMFFPSTKQCWMYWSMRGKLCAHNPATLYYIVSPALIHV